MDGVCVEVNRKARAGQYTLAQGWSQSDVLTPIRSSTSTRVWFLNESLQTRVHASF